MKVLLASLLLVATVCFGEGEKLAVVDTAAGKVSGLVGTTFIPQERGIEDPVKVWAITTQGLEAVTWDGIGTDMTWEKGEACPLLRVCRVSGLPPEVRDELRGIEWAAEVQIGDSSAFLPADCVILVPAASVPGSLADRYKRDAENYLSTRQKVESELQKAEAAEKRRAKRAERAERNRVAAEQGRQWLAAQQQAQALEQTREQIQAIRQELERARYGK